MSRQLFKPIRLLVVLAMLVAVVIMQMPQPTHAVDNPTYWPTNGWQSSTPEEQGMDSAELAGFVNFVADPTFYADSVIVIRHGYIVAEAYADPVTMTDWHHMYSASKSITSMIYGLALSQGLVPPLDTLVLEAFPNTFENVDAMKEAMTVRDLLMMSSGLHCDGLDPAVGDQGVYDSNADWVQAAGSLPMWYEPGTEFHYCNPDTTLLSGLISLGTGMSALDYAKQNLFAPLGITQAEWTADAQGVNFGASELRLTPRDMAKLGFLMLHNGQWEDQQLLPAEWVADSTAVQIETPWNSIGMNYGYQWWYLTDVNLHFAVGHGGQYIAYQPDNDTLLVITSHAVEPVRLAHSAFRILYTFAGLSTADAALPANTAAYAALTDALAAMTAPEAVIPTLPEMAATISAKTYNLLNQRVFSGSRRAAVREPVGTDMSIYNVASLALTFDSDFEATLTLNFADGEVVQIPVGLDGLYWRSENSRLGLIAAKGTWTDADTFRLNLRQVDDVDEYRMDFSFAQELLEVIIFELSEAEAYAVLGMMAQ